MKQDEKDHDAIDGCVCDLKHDSHTEDHELPPPRGGIEIAKEHAARISSDPPQAGNHDKSGIRP